jgi:hypothetical protein
MIHHPTDPGLFLVEPPDLVLDGWCGARDRQAVLFYCAVLGWLENFLCKPHPELGRGGPVCPFVRPSLDKDLLWLTSWPGRPAGAEEVAEVVIKYCDWFLQLEPREGEDSIDKAILVLFPALLDDAKFPLLDEAQALARPRFLERGTMLGQFHPRSNKQGLRSTEFRPSCPVPLLAIRFMTRYDLPFLVDNDLNFYLKNFGNNVPGRLKEMLRQALLTSR